MKLRFNVFGYEIARIDLDIEREETPMVQATAVRGVKLLSKLWFAGMTR